MFINKKECATCGKLLLVLCFYNRADKIGLRSDCKKCMRIKNKQWAIQNKGKCSEYTRKYYHSNKEKCNKKRFQYGLLRKWQSSYTNARTRCTNANTPSYKYYGKRGIRFLLSPTQVQFLWFKDNAFNLKNPSIDRVNSKGNYELDNCKFIELSENSKKMHKEHGHNVH